MKDKITCFKLNWYNFSNHWVYDTNKVSTTVYRKNNLLTVKALNGLKETLSYDKISINEKKVDAFFNYLEEIFEELKDNSDDRILDGSAWTIHIWHGAHKIKKISGRIPPDPFGDKIEAFLHSFVNDSKSDVKLYLF